MDRRLILAVAGSGKTTYLINSIDPSKRYLIVTYTENNLSHIRRRIVDRFGFLPDNVNLLSYFQFLFRVCYRPFLKDKFNAKGITWNLPEDWTRFRNGAEHYLSSHRNLYHNRLAKLCLKECAPQIKERIEKCQTNEVPNINDKTVLGIIKENVLTYKQSEKKVD